MVNNVLIQEERQKARKKAMRLLEHMDRTEKGLYEKLCRSGFSQDAVLDAIEYVKSFGYINDLRYAGQYISGRLGKKSRQKILQELIQKGIERDTAEEAWALETQDEEPDEKEAIRKEIEKKYEKCTVLNEKEMRRLYGYLSRRGFKAGDIMHVLEELEITCSRENNS